MDRYERLSTLLDLLGQRGKVDVDDVAGELSVSAATIRRDLDHLAEQQLLTRTRGGAVANNVAYDLPLRYKTARQASEKERIGRAAAAAVTRGSVVGLNGGTTTTEVARALALLPDLNGAEEP
ncbi:DeoR/GlpR family DNA-binding transcription regulator, partial [Actinophytocola sp.]|uniref:DeoR/GlpR family DNA-binding transcription regulator n=1 Tax=Actinophytocola sp. TaxID=1872138 RepID=UPI002D3267C7